MAGYLWSLGFGSEDRTALHSSQQGKQPICQPEERIQGHLLAGGDHPFLPAGAAPKRGCHCGAMLHWTLQAGQGLWMLVPAVWCCQLFWLPNVCLPSSLQEKKNWNWGSMYDDVIQPSRPSFLFPNIQLPKCTFKFQLHIFSLLWDSLDCLDLSNGVNCWSSVQWNPIAQLQFWRVHSFQLYETGEGETNRCWPIFHKASRCDGDMDWGLDWNKLRKLQNSTGQRYTKS